MHEIIKELESNNSRLFKESVLLREMQNSNDVFFKALSYSCDKLKTFGVKQIPISKIDGFGLSWSQFEELLDKLIRRLITGYEARDEIFRIMDQSKSDEWNFFFRRILMKDLRCGVSEKTINNVAEKNGFKEFKIPVFSCQLAQDSEQHQKKIVGEKFLEVKLDGVRTISILYQTGKVDIFSRNGKELNNFDHIKKELYDSISQKKLKESIVLDGEVVSKNFQELMKQIYRKDNIQNTDANLYLFDILPLKDFQVGTSKIIQSERIKNLEEWYKFNTNFKYIKLLDRKLLNLDLESDKEKLKEFNNNAVIKGFEGIMIKDPKSYYECKRSSSWLKSKPVIQVSLTVKNIEEGTGRNKNKLGAISVEGFDEGKFFKLSVGSGFTDKQREQFWGEKKALIGQIIEIKADAMTQSQDKKNWSLRFPRFKSFRGFEKNEKL